MPAVKARLVLLLLVALLVGACDSASESVSGVRDRIAAIDIDATLEGLRDCDRLSGAFVGAVRTAADAVDGLAERANGRVPETDIRNAVDGLAVSNYFAIAERIGCTQVQQRLDTIDQLRELSPDTPAGEDFLEEIMRQVQAQG